MAKDLNPDKLVSRSMSAQIRSHYESWLSTSSYAGSSFASDTSWLSKPYAQMSPAEANILRDPGVIGTSGWEPGRVSDLPFNKWQRQMERKGALTQEGTWSDKAPSDYTSALHKANIDPSGVNVGSREALKGQTSSTKTGSTAKNETSVKIEIPPESAKTLKELGDNVNKATRVAGEAARGFQSGVKSFENRGSNNGDLTPSGRFSSQSSAQHKDNLGAVTQSIKEAIPLNMVADKGVKQQTATRSVDGNKKSHRIDGRVDFIQPPPGSPATIPRVGIGNPPQVVVQANTPNAANTRISPLAVPTGSRHISQGETTVSANPAYVAKLRDRTEGSAYKTMPVPMQGLSHVKAETASFLEQERLNKQRAENKAAIAQAKQEMADASYVSGIQKRWAAAASEKGFVDSTPVPYEPLGGISSARQEAEGAAYAPMNRGGLSHYTPPPPPPAAPPPRGPSGRYERPFSPGLASARDKISGWAGPQLADARKRMVHHAGSAAIWTGTGLAMGGAMGLAKSAAGGYAEDFDASMQQLIGVGYTEPMRAYARQRILHTASTHPHINPAKMANALYELSSGITPTVEGLPKLMDQAERFQTYALTYTQDPARTSLEIGKMSNMLKNHPSYKGLTKEQAYERTFFHIAPLVETELFHGKDLMTAAQYFMNPAMNMMGWSPGEAFAMSGILQSAGIAPSTTGTALRQAIDENLYKGMARTQFVAEQVNAHNAAGKGYPLIASGAQDRFFTSKKAGGEWGLVVDPTTGAKISPRQRLNQIIKEKLHDTSASGFLKNLELQRRQVELLAGEEYGYSPQQLGISATLIPTLHSMTPERIQEIKKAAQSADNVTLSEEEQKRRIEQRKSSEAPGSVYSKFEQSITAWANSPGNRVRGVLELATGIFDSLASDNAIEDHYRRSIHSKDAKTRQEHAFFFKDSINQQAHKYVKENYPNAAGEEKAQLVRDREDYLNRFYSMKTSFDDSPLGIASSIFPGVNYAFGTIGSSIAAHAQQRLDRWYQPQGSAGAPTADSNILPTAYSAYVQNFAKYANSGQSQSVSNINTLGQMVTSTLPLSGLMPKFDSITKGYPETPSINISIGNKEVEDFTATTSIRTNNRRNDEEKSTSNVDTSSSVPIGTGQSDLPTIGGYSF